MLACSTLVYGHMTQMVVPSTVRTKPVAKAEHAKVPLTARS